MMIPALSSGGKQDLPEIVIEANECTLLSLADLTQHDVLTPFEALISNGQDIVPGGPQKFQSSTPDIFIELELHAKRLVGRNESPPEREREPA